MEQASETAAEQAAKEREKLKPEEIAAAQKEVSDEIGQISAEPEKVYQMPPYECLEAAKDEQFVADRAELKATADKLIEALDSFNVGAQVVDIVPGPSVTRYELKPATGVKISKFTGLADDLALHLAAPAGIRIEAPIPNKAAIGIEVPNRERTPVHIRELLEAEEFRKAKSKLFVTLGRDIAGSGVYIDIAKMPHLLVAGTTGSGKSVCLNAMIVSILYNAKPSEVKLLLIDPKSVEFAVYADIPHLLVPVVSDARKAAGALGWAVTEMMNRYNVFTSAGVKDIESYNRLCTLREDLEFMPQIVIIIDELADLMSVAPSEVEESIFRLAQMARAAGMHLILATQRPSVDVITGVIKSNIPSRIALSVSSIFDSRTILDMGGAEKLLGKGDMLVNPIGRRKPVRVQGCYVSDEELRRVTEFVKTQETSEYDENIEAEIERQTVVEK
ncbi:MAG: DNA translocase FtsK, partial [Clostridia bacterium]|nr:DNA translocase FtsK [Clostridia bacterium]